MSSRIVCLKDPNGVDRFYDFGTKNESFLLTCRELKEVGVKHWYFPLEIKYPEFNLGDVDPYDPHLNPQDIGKVIYECKANPWYFFREVMKIPVRGVGKKSMILRRNSAAAIWCFVHSLDFLINSPRQLQKTTTLTGIIEYSFLFEYQNIEIPYMHIKMDRCKENAEMLRDYITTLPDYLNPWCNRTKLPGIQSLKYDEHNVSITLLASADSESKARDKMRGMTLFTSFIDEWEYIPYIDTVLEGATPAIISGREIMRKNGGRTCMMFASTPGDLDTSTGKAAQRIIDRTPPFTEKLYDLTDKQFEEFLDGATNIDENGNPIKVSTVYIEYNYKQLRQTEDWVREQHNEAVRNNKMAEYRRGILLERFRGGIDGSLFLQEDIEYIKAHVRQPDKEILLLNKYLLYVYDHPLRNIDLNSETPYFDIDIPYLVGIDISGGTGGDNTAIIVVNPYTFQIVAELASPYIGGLDLIRCIIQLAKLMPKAVFCPETNSVGKPMLEWIQDSHLEYRFYCDPKLDITKNVTMDQDDLEAKLKHKALMRKYIGTNVTPKIRGDMMTLLKRYVHDYRHLINSKLLVKDIDALTINKGKIEAESGEHDDVVMAYNHVLYVFTYGYDLTRYGINKKLCSFEEAYREVKRFDYDQEAEVVNNMKPYGRGAYGYEEQLLHDIINSSEQAGFDRQSGVDPYGYKTSEYNQINMKQNDDIVHATRADISFFSSVQNF